MVSLRLLALALAICAPVAAEPIRLAQQELYKDAVQSIAEGRQSDASDLLSRMVEQEPQHAGAWLDLAIVQCELGRAAEAERLFHIIESRFSPPAGIVEVIESYRATGCKGWRPRSQLSMALARGTDSNVNQGASDPNFSIGSGSSRIDLQLAPEYLPQRDRYTLLSAEYSRELAPNGSIGFVQLRARQNDTLSRYDTASLRAGVERAWRIDDWGIRGTAALGALTLGGDLYQKQAQLMMRVAPPLSLPERLRFNLQTGVTRVDYPTLTNFDSNTLELGGQLTYRSDKTQIQASAGLLSDRGNPGRPGGDRRGWFAGIQSQTLLVHDLIGELGWTRQDWHGDVPYSPGLIDQIRRQHSQLFRTALIIPIKKEHALQIEFRQVRNNENISIFQYNSRLLQVSWQWQPF